ncbi:MAG: prepilin-type N-terminal cleavage/methylation domain-containing protein [Candidatus Omnitrophica bacterium]|nr:prepilin-type N-terminal cleavage/methylation domain-containing protein [Candidatus Omnitrophota bacterium]
MTLQNKAFTLLELIIVIVILGIIFSISTPRFRATYTTIQLRNTAQGVINLSRLIRQQAILKRAVYKIEFKQMPADSNDKSYFSVFHKDGSSGEFIADTDRLAKVETPKGIKIEMSKPAQFYSDGTMDMGGTEIYLKSDVKKITLKPSNTNGFFLLSEDPL